MKVLIGLSCIILLGCSAKRDNASVTYDPLAVPIVKCDAPRLTTSHIYISICDEDPNEPNEIPMKSDTLHKN